jgi:hypothetical protein
MTGSDSIRDVIAFPKTQRAQDLLTQAPSPVDEKQLRELHIKLRNAAVTTTTAEKLPLIQRWCCGAGRWRERPRQRQFSLPAGVFYGCSPRRACEQGGNLLRPKCCAAARSWLAPAAFQPRSPLTLRPLRRYTG